MRTAFAVAAALATPLACEAVYVSPDGQGQALIFPYYTVQSTRNEFFNTYFSVVNTTAKAKVVRVRFREGRNARSVAEFNLYLAGNDVWTGALVPTSVSGSAPARLVTVDASCTSPTLGPLSAANPGRDFSNALYSGSLADGAGEGLERTREGYFEMLEMGTLTGATAAAVTFTANGTPANCGAVQAGAPLPGTVEPPEGGLAGTATFINVANGMDMSVVPEALADLSTQPFYRGPGDDSADFNAPEILPVSQVLANGWLYRSQWTRPVDAVSAVLMRRQWNAEYVLDRTTQSNTDVVVTFPTRHYHVAATQAPFPAAFNYAGCLPLIGGIGVFTNIQNRQSQGQNRTGTEFPERPLGTGPVQLCGSANVIDLFGAAQSADESLVLGSRNRAAQLGGVVPSEFDNGWLAMSPYSLTGSLTLTSLPGSTRTSLRTGDVFTGAHVHEGLPVTGFYARTFRNGNLACNATTCQGNYGSAIPLTYRRAITP